MKKRLILLLILIALNSFSHAIQVSGDVYGVWTADNNPYEVTGDMRVPQCSTLIIEPGCYIDFQGYYMLLVDTSACLRALGTELDSVIFTTEDTLNCWLGIHFYSADSSSILSHCIIEWGITDDEINPVYFDGGGVYCNSTDMEIANCLFRKNMSWGNGGGLYCNYSYITISDNIFIDNKTVYFHGAGICCDYCDVIISNNLIKDNIIYNLTGGERGGGIYCAYSDVVIRGNIISNNESWSDGGGVYIQRCRDIIFESNIICNNWAATNCGGIIVNAPTNETREYYDNNLIYGNEAALSGGGLRARNIINFENNTICNNIANWMGGGLTVGPAFIEEPLMNNIIRGNTAGVGPQIYSSTDSFTVIYSNIEDGWPGEGNINADPLFCGSDTGNFYLAENSPCVGTGYNGANMGAFGIGCDPVGILEHFSYLPDDFELFQNHPNPFNARTTIRYNLIIPTDITIDIYDILGRKVETLISIKQPAGEHQVIWDAMDKSSGMYFYRLQAEDCVETKKMLLLK